MKKFFVLLVAIALSTMLYAAKGEQGSSHGQPFLTLQGQIDKLVGDADTVELRLTGLEAATVKLEGDVAALNVELDGLHTEVSQLRGYVSDYTDNIKKNLDYIIEIRGVIDLMIDQLQVFGEYTQDSLEAMEAAMEENANDISNNFLIIQAMGYEIESIEANMELKQNIINGICPEGQAVVSVNDEENDGELICKAVSVSGDLETTVITKSMSIPAFHTSTIVADCPAGTVVTGGGFGHMRSEWFIARSSRSDGNSWSVAMENTYRFDRSAISSVNCLKLQ